MAAVFSLTAHAHPQLLLHPEAQQSRKSSRVTPTCLPAFGKSSTASAGEMGEDPSEEEDVQEQPCEKDLAALQPKEWISVLRDFPVKEQN